MTQEINTTQAQPQGIQPIMKYLPQFCDETGAVKKSGALVKAHKTALGAFKSNEMQLSGLSKNCGAMYVQAVISLVLKEVFDLTLSPVNADQLAAMAEEIQSNFWMLKFEEIVFALKKGINGGYEKIYGHVNYQHVSSWIDSYMTERTIAISNDRDKNHLAKTSIHESVQALAGLPQEAVELIGKDADDNTAKTKVPELTKEEIQKRLADGARLVQFDRFKKHLSVTRLQEWMEEAKENNWKDTMSAINGQLKLVLSFSVRALAKKIRAGITEFTPTELQLHLNNSKELEIELKRLSNEVKENSSPEKSGTETGN